MRRPLVGLLLVFAACGNSSSKAKTETGCANDRQACPGACNLDGYCEQNLGWGTEIRVPAGTYVVYYRGRLAMGAVEDGLATFPSPYWIDKHEMSVGLAKKCADCGANASDADDQPAQVTRAQALSICAAGGRRLPTNYEWEAAGRGPSPCTDPGQMRLFDPKCNGRLYPWTAVNSEPDDFCAHALIRDCGTPTGPRAIADHPEGASPLGVQELIGNVTEWISDMEKDEGVVKGGDWELAGDEHAYAQVKLIARERRAVDKQSGFRCVRGPVMDLMPKLRPSAYGNASGDGR
jgi:formylglycine-generating enzyme required for sulfatase activity